MTSRNCVELLQYWVNIYCLHQKLASRGVNDNEIFVTKRIKTSWMTRNILIWATLTFSFQVTCFKWSGFHLFWAKYSRCKHDKLINFTIKNCILRLLFVVTNQLPSCATFKINNIYIIYLKPHIKIYERCDYCDVIVTWSL